MAARNFKVLSAECCLWYADVLNSFSVRVSVGITYKISLARWSTGTNEDVYLFSIRNHVICTLNGKELNAMRLDLKPEAEHFCQLCFQLNIELLWTLPLQRIICSHFPLIKPDLLRKTEQEACCRVVTSNVHRTRSSSTNTINKHFVKRNDQFWKLPTEEHISFDRQFHSTVIGRERNNQHHLCVSLK